MVYFPITVLVSIVLFTSSGIELLDFDVILQEPAMLEKSTSEGEG